MDKPILRQKKVYTLKVLYLFTYGTSKRRMPKYCHPNVAYASFIEFS